VQSDLCREGLAVSQHAFRGFALDSSLMSLLLAVLFALCVEPAPGFAYPTSDPLNAELLTATGQVLLPDGSRAANALVSAIGDQLESGTTVRADSEGRFQLKSTFGTICGIHAHTSDLRQQATLSVPPCRARTAFLLPLALKLAPGREQRVLVKAAGKPAQDVRVVASSVVFQVAAKTGPDGVASLWLPPGRDSNEIVAWDPKLGGAEIMSYAPSRPAGVVELSLLAPKSQTVRVVNQRMKLVPNLPCLVTCVTPAGFFGTSEFDEAIVRTDSRGEVTIPWLPDHLTSVELHPISPAWKVDDVYMPAKASDGLPTVHVRRRRPVTGRLVMPPGANPEGILVQGNGFGGGGTGDRPFARVRRD